MAAIFLATIRRVLLISKYSNNREQDKSDGNCVEKEVPGTNHLYYELRLIALSKRSIK